jgi:hypothetical protein
MARVMTRGSCVTLENAQMHSRASEKNDRSVQSMISSCCPIMKRGPSHPAMDRDRGRNIESKRSKPAELTNKAPVGVVGCSETFDYSEIDDSRHTADRVLSWFVSPLSHLTFQSELRDKKHYRSQRCNPTYFSGLFSRASFMELVDRKKLEYDKHIVARKSYYAAVSADDAADNAHSEVGTHHFCRKGIARSQAIEKALLEGYAVELLRPQQYGGQLWRLCSWLEEAMGSPSGCNVCLLPPEAVRGETAHEDSDNFMLQVDVHSATVQFKILLKLLTIL